MMKKLMFLLMLLFSILPVFSFNSETCTSVSYSHGFVNTKVDAGELKFIAPGFDLSVSSYFGKKNFGLYVNAAYFFPTSITSTLGNITVRRERSYYDGASIISAIFGFTYRWPIQKFDISVALGMHIAQTMLRKNTVSSVDYSFGIGSDIAFRYYVIKNLYLTAGGLFGYDFYSTGMIKTTYRNINVSGKINSFTLAPYIGLGVRF